MDRGARVTLAPDVEYLAFFINAFHELSSCRISMSGIGQIPFTAIVEYARIYSVEDYDEFSSVIRIMDNTFINLNSKSKEADARKRSKKSNPKSKGGG